MSTGSNECNVVFKVLFWNINGRWRFLNDENIVRWIEQFNIIYLSETHFTKGQVFNISNYKAYHNPISDVNDGKPRWGVSCFISHELLQYVIEVDRSFDNHILVLLKGGHRIFGSYIPPVDSLYYSEEYYHTIPCFLSPVNNDCVFIGGGDMNSRVGNMQAPQGIGASFRTNPDTFLNSHGRLLKRICKNTNSLVLNNLNFDKKKFDGDFTFEKGGNKSQNDFCCTNISGLQRVNSFDIHNLSFNFSDHKPISVTVEIPILSGVSSSIVADDILSNSWDVSPKRPKKIVVENVDWGAYKTLASLEVNKIYNEIRRMDVLDNEKFQRIVDDMENNLYQTATFCQKVNLDIGTEKSKTFVDENRSVNEIDEEISRNEHEKWQRIVTSKDPRSLWKNIEWKGPRSQLQMSTPSAREFGEHFMQKATLENEEVFVFDGQGEYVPELDDDISLEEVEKAANKLKEKSTSDGWTPKMITSISNVFYPLLVLILNFILQCGYYPNKWRSTIVSTLFKNKGVTWLVKYFRPVSLVRLLCKMFDFIFLERFRRWFKPHDGQSAYLSKRSCGDHVFLIRALVNYCMNSNKKLFIICIDFEGAFDKISRHKLFRKLKLFGAGTVFLSCLMVIYSVTPCTIIQSDNDFTYLLMAGIKQGLPLSPWLFLFYINDIFDLFESIYGRTSLLDTIHLLIHADDTTILASSREDAESKLKTLLSYCKNNYISLQLTKCEFIVINGNDNDKTDFLIPNGVVRHVEVVKLLGSHITESGSIDVDLSHHMKDRYLAVLKFFNFIRSNKLAPSAVKLKVLEACVTSSLLHNCETFGKHIPENLEKIYFELIKVSLGVRWNTPNQLALIESGMLRLQGIIHSRQYKFYLNFIEQLEPNSARSTVFYALRNLNIKYLEHYSNLISTFESAKAVKMDHLNQTKEKITNLSRSGDHYKFQIYCDFNPELNPADLTKSYSYAFSRLKLSSHTMPVELLRWNRISREIRLCNVCGVVGDERHYIYDCPTINREDLNDIPELNELASYQKLPKLLKVLNAYL